MNLTDDFLNLTGKIALKIKRFYSEHHTRFKLNAEIYADNRITYEAVIFLVNQIYKIYKFDID